MRASAETIAHAILTAPAPDGSVFVLVPDERGAVVTRLGVDGLATTGWPLSLPHASACNFMGVASDGTLRLVCEAQDQPAETRPDFQIIERAFALDVTGRAVAGWPILIDQGQAAGVAGDDLLVLASGPFVGRPPARLLTVPPNGAVSEGNEVPLDDRSGGQAWAISTADRVAYGVRDTWSGADHDVAVPNAEIVAIGEPGLVPGWAVTVTGAVSPPVPGPVGDLLVAVGTPDKVVTRILYFAAEGGAPHDRSEVLPIRTAETGVDCVSWTPPAPVVADDGTTFLFSDLDRSVYALSRGLDVKAGWPYRPSTGRPLVGQEEPEAISCLPHAVPAAGPNGSLFLSLAAASEKTGGGLVAVNPNGRVRAGWPVNLTRAGSEFWSVAVGPDGTAYALAIEPESARSFSATLLGIAPDSTVRWATTLVEP